MKKGHKLALALLLLLSLGLTVAATELTGLTLEADTVTAAPGQTVTVSVRITQNPGFTNMAVLLEYDRQAMTLQSITPGALCGHSAVQPQWTGEEGLSYGYGVFAAASAVEGTGILFTATFQVAQNFTGTAAVTPSVVYARDNSALLSVFETVPAQAVPGAVTSEEEAPMVLPGDLNGDGEVTTLDLAALYNALRFDTAMPAAADLNGDGELNALDLAALYNQIRYAK